MQLAAAWHRLASRLPPSAGMGPSAELILNALKLALAYAPPGASAGADGRPAAERALALASLLAELSGEGLPPDAEAIAAGILAEMLPGPGSGPWAASLSSLSSLDDEGLAGAAAPGPLSLEVVEARVGPLVAQLAHDVQRVHALPSRVDLCDDEAARRVPGRGGLSAGAAATAPSSPRQACP